ncbi:MAG: 50S ribosomal protein L11 methyltransferase [Aestuariivita sp.]|nr:50S ribosomal protein L11 methyltransferase [Aestuariivita sp.]
MVVVYSALTTVREKVSVEALSEALEHLEPAPIGIDVSRPKNNLDSFEITSFFDSRPDEVALALLSTLLSTPPFIISKIPEINWIKHVGQEHPALRLGQFFIFSSHHRDNRPDNVKSIFLESTMAFGTGQHGSTEGCIRSIEWLKDSGFAAESIADIGCGTSVLAMASAQTWNARIVASDIDNEAVESANINLRANCLHKKVVCMKSTGFYHSEHAQNAPYDLIFANIFKNVLISLASDVKRHNSAEGYVVLSGILKGQADNVLSSYVMLGYVLVNRFDINEWTTLILFNKYQ